MNEIWKETNIIEMIWHDDKMKTERKLDEN